MTPFPALMLSGRLRQIESFVVFRCAYPHALQPGAFRLVEELDELITYSARREYT